MVAAVNTSLRLGKVQCHLLPARTTLLTLQGTLSAPGSTPLLILVRVLAVGVENKAHNDAHSAPAKCWLSLCTGPAGQDTLMSSLPGCRGGP